MEYGRTKARPVADAGVDRATDDPYVQQAVGEMSVIAHGAEAMVLRAGAVLDATVAAQAGLSGEALQQSYATASIAVNSIPAIRTEPLSGYTMPAIRLRKVVFPLPLSPYNPTCAPAVIANASTVTTRRNSPSGVR